MGCQTIMGECREASHAGSWYSSSGIEAIFIFFDDFLREAKDLKEQFNEWFEQAGQKNHFHEKLYKSKMLIVPHAGYRYSGPTAAYSYHELIKFKGHINRIIMVGPSHRVHLDPPCQVTSFKSLETPLGDLEVDLEAVNQLKFGKLSTESDDAEHSLEMQLPILKYALNCRAEAGIQESPKILPLLLSDPTETDIVKLASSIHPLLNDDSSVLIISSDFCHWGKSFHYHPPLDSLLSQVDDEIVPLHKRIQLLDETAMSAIETGRHNFELYLEETQNTICGHDPIRLALELCTMGTLQYGRWRWLNYAQSDQIVSSKSSSSQVSYVAGVFQLKHRQ